MKRQQQGGRSVRLLRVGELVRHALSDILRRDMVQDPDLTGVSVTVTGADVSPDLRNATIHFQPLGGADAQTVLAALNRSSGFLRGQLGKSVSMKYLPKLQFVLDQSFDEAGKIDALLADPRVARDLQSRSDSDEQDGDA